MPHPRKGMPFYSHDFTFASLFYAFRWSTTNKQTWSTGDQQNSKTTEPTTFAPGEQHPEQGPQEFEGYLEKRF
ncbi:ATP synthase subunit 8 [Gossypium australe]|uniref:ATP synthase subunit 8 n=1 Tax=Gossypium australe TaxID=47621 RepID=A0A5B6WZI5_9ROSI|nr:ATP synthase subunit 8 [Gossypium australe]